MEGRLTAKDPGMDRKQFEESGDLKALGWAGGGVSHIMGIYQEGEGIGNSETEEQAEERRGESLDRGG